MKSLIPLAGALVLTAGVIHADQGQGRGQGQRGQDERTASERAPSRPAQVSVVFSPRDLTLIRTHYDGKFKGLPPGLRNKLARGGTLPPGWQKKMDPLPSSLLRQLPVLGSGHKYGIHDGHAVIYDPLTHAILDIVSLF